MGLFDKLFGRSGGNDGGDDPPEFTALLAQGMNGLGIQTESHTRTWGLGHSERWDFSQDDGQLVFTFEDKIVSAPAQIIGSFDSREGTWLWSWANDSFDDALKRDSRRVREYGKEHGIARLTEPGWYGEESDGWEMTAFANRLCESNGAYRGPAGSTFVFFTFGAVQITRR